METASPLPPTIPSTTSSVPPSEPERSKRRWVPWMLGAAGVLAVAGVSYQLTDGARSDNADSTTNVVVEVARPRLSQAPAPTTLTPPVDDVGPTSPKLEITTMAHDELTFTWTPSVDLPIPGGVGVGGYDIYVDSVLAGRWPGDATEAVVMTTERTDGEPHSIIVVPVDKNGTTGTPGWATVKRGPELGVTTG